jgi:hypothetical protein
MEVNATDDPRVWMMHATCVGAMEHALVWWVKHKMRAIGVRFAGCTAIDSRQTQWLGIAAGVVAVLATLECASPTIF